ncbi:response regulator MprA [Streptomyces acidiscabies]|nr:response regulator MprA [Streptomyces acidiscabies]
MGKSRTRWPVRTYSQGVPGASGRVLVVDDNKVIRQLIRVNLELEGFEVVTACDGAECLEVVHEVRPDAVTLDVVMPRLDGLRTAAQLRADPRTRDLPLAIVSACTPDEVYAGLDAGVDVFLPKPFEPADLVDIVRKLVRQGQDREYDGPEAAPVPAGPDTSGQTTGTADSGEPDDTHDHDTATPDEPAALNAPGEQGAHNTPGRPTALNNSGEQTAPDSPGELGIHSDPVDLATPHTAGDLATPSDSATAHELANPHHGDEKRPAQSGS